MSYLPAFLLLLTSSAFAVTPAEQKIAAAATGPKSPQSYNDLATAFCQRARETGNPSYYGQAAAALEQSRTLAPNDYTAQKIQIAILLGRNQFAEALKQAQSLNHKVPDDIPVWGFLAEANFYLGNYAESEKAAQWMFDLRPGNPAGFLPAAKLREVSGDLEGAIQFTDEAYRHAPESEITERSLLLAESARLQIQNGNPKQAADLLTQAYRLYPDNPHALKISAQLNRAEAPTLLARRCAQTNTTASLYDWAEALEQAGQTQQAAAKFQEFETKAKAETQNPYNANRELIFYYADHRKDTAQAVVLAKQERGVRHDLPTLDAYAWALFRNGQLKEAKAQIDEALETGTRDLQIRSHAARITAFASSR